MTSGKRLVLALLWLAALVVAGWAVSQRLQLSGDLRKFMPEPQTPAQKLLIDELGEGPGARLLLIGLSGTDAETLAAQSRALHAKLAADDRFEFIANGEDAGLDAIPEHLRPYRYLLSPTLDTQRFDASYLRAQLDERMQDLGSPAAALIEPLLPSDPTLETLKLAETWQPANAPQRLHGVWFDRAGREALIVAQTRAAGFDPTGQQAAYDAVHAAFAAARGGSDKRLANTRLTMTGPGAFSVEIGGRTQREAQWIGTVDTIGLVLLLLIAYRSWKTPLHGVLPLASAGLAGLGAVALLFTEVHGITVAFGFTLIGVVQDYPIHFFSHQRAGVSPWANVRALWPTLATGVVATCIAYVTFLFSGVDGLRQLAVFTIAGLATAALATRFALPALVDPGTRDFADSPRLQRLWSRIARLPRPRWTLLALAFACIATIALARGPFWQNDLSKLTPVPADALAQDARLRDELGAPDVRYVLVVRGNDAEAVLRASERLRPTLDALVTDRTIAGYDMAARYLPSVATQRARQAKLPDDATLRAALDAALADTPFRADAFEDFVADVTVARAAKPLTANDLKGTPLATRVEGLLLSPPRPTEREEGQLREAKAEPAPAKAGGEGPRNAATALISLTGLTNPTTVARIASDHGAELLDMKQASESLVAEYRERVLLALLFAAVLLAATVWIALRSPRRTLRVLLPMALTTLVILAVLRAFGVELTLFHLVALILAAGLGLDYALFFEHAGDDRDDQIRTLHAVIVCSLMTLLVFALLALSSIPVLRAIGSTVAIGVLSNFVLALLIARHDDAVGPSLGRDASTPSLSPQAKGRVGEGSLPRSAPTESAM